MPSMNFALCPFLQPLISIELSQIVYIRLFAQIRQEQNNKILIKNRPSTKP